MIGIKILSVRKSKYNGKIVVSKSLGFGTYIQAEGLTQSGGIVETIWKSTLRKIHNSKFVIHNSLILGLGGGTAAKLIRKNWPDAKITGVDIDPAMVELGKKHLRLDEFGVEIKIGDVENATGVPVLALLPDDVMVLESLSKTTPTTAYSPKREVAVEYKKLAGCIAGQEFVDNRMRAKVKSLFRMDMGKQEVNRAAFLKDLQGAVEVPIADVDNDIKKK